MLQLIFLGKNMCIGWGVGIATYNIQVYFFVPRISCSPTLEILSRAKITLASVPIFCEYFVCLKSISMGCCFLTNFS